MSPAAPNQTAGRRPENLALIFQEVLTAIERLRAGRQNVSDAQAFRHHTREVLKAAAAHAMTAAYPAEDVKYATFAVVAFLDESILNSQNPIFADWLRKPLQEELFGTHIAGEVFFQNLQVLIGRQDSQDLADLLEVYLLCLLLGFNGRYSAGNRGELAQTIAVTSGKIRRIRGLMGPLSPSWMPPAEAAGLRADPWVRRFTIALIAITAFTVILFIGYKIGLGSGASSVHTAAMQVKG